MNPQQLALQLDQARSLMQAGKVADARRLAQTLLRGAPSDPRCWHLSSQVHAKEGRLPEALEDIRHAAHLAQNDTAFRLQEGQYLIAMGRRREALAVANGLIDVHLDRADWNDALGTLFTLCDEPARAERFFELAVAQASQDSRYHYNLAAVQRMLGQLDRAAHTLDRVIAMNPSNAFAYYTRSDLRVQTEADNHIDEMISALRDHIRYSGDKILMRFAIAKELDDVGRYDLAFDYLKAGNDAQRSLYKYDVSSDTSAIDTIIDTYDQTQVSVSRGLRTAECIFVMGLPRTGTTLAERILAGHSAVYGAGELQSFPLAVVNEARRLAGHQVAKHDLARWALKIDALQLGKAYLGSTRPQTGNTPHFVDKQPINYLYAGLIRRALPDARLIAVTRDPVDTCFAMYRTLFTGAYPFAYALHELAAYYLAWHRLMRHWQAVFGRDLLIVRYEDMVLNFEATARRMIAHCCLDWESGCLSFQDRKAAVMTASAAQVRRPIYTSSIGKWKNYGRQLAPLIALLDEFEPPGGWGFGQG